MARDKNIPGEMEQRNLRRKKAAERALAEAEERRRNSEPVTLAPELGGRDGPEPTRFGDWERKGITSDF